MEQKLQKSKTKNYKNPRTKQKSGKQNYKNLGTKNYTNSRTKVKNMGTKI
jgi:hypothetical protein